MRPGSFRWEVGDRLATLKRLYLDEEMGSTAIAEAIGQGCTAKIVKRKVTHLGLAIERGPEVTQRFRDANFAKRHSRGPPRAAAPLAARSAPPRGRRAEGLPEDLQAAIAAAIAAGKVTILPPGVAAGLTRWEQALHTCPAPHSSPMERAERSRRAARKTKLLYAARGGGGR